MFVITGASGNLGRATATELAKQVGAGKIRLASRSPEKLEDLRAQGFETVRADYDDPASLDAAYAGADRVLIISALDDAADPMKRKRQHRAAIEAARKAGVKHIVYTSMVSPHPTTGPSLPDDHYDTELALAQSGVPFTALRNNIYADALVTMFLPGPLATGSYMSSAREGRIAYVLRADCARAAAAALVNPPADRSVVHVTGPDALSTRDLVELVRDVVGVDLKYVPVEAVAYREVLAGAGLPPPVADFVISFDRMIADGFLGIATDDVAQLTGTAATSVRDFLTQNRAALVPA